LEDLKGNTRSTKEKHDMVDLEDAQLESAATLLEELAPELNDHSVDEVFKNLEPEQKKIISRMFSFSGPLPPPTILRGYAEFYPEAPEKIFSWVEEQQRHRQELENKQLEYSYKYQQMGLVLGSIITSFLVLGSFILILLDKEVIGLSVLTPTLVSLVSMIIHNNKKNKKTDSDEKQSDKDDNK
jgi:uncharacterized membrane protein